MVTLRKGDDGEWRTDAEPIDEDWFGPCRMHDGMTCWTRRLCGMIRECVWRPIVNVPDPAGLLSDGTS